MNDEVHMVFEGEMVDYVTKSNPSKYQDFIFTSKRGTKLVYVKLFKAIYKCMQSALLWYTMFSDFLVEQGFIINPVDNYVANKLIHGKQSTICRYVDDLKISHKNYKVLSTIIKNLEDKFGKINVSRGRKHTYIGADIEFNNNKEVLLSIKTYIQECVNDFGEDLSLPAVTPAAKHLFTVGKDTPCLDTKRSDIFHSIVMKLLWVSKRSRPDIQTALSFLCCRTSKSDTDDWKKLKRVFRYLNCTLDLPLTLSADAITRLLIALMYHMLYIRICAATLDPA